MPRKISEKYYGPVNAIEVGTAAYMAPEVWEGEDATSMGDMWSLGCAMYELMTLERPFRGSIDRIKLSILTGTYKKIKSGLYSWFLKDTV